MLSQAQVILLKKLRKEKNTLFILTNVMLIKFFTKIRIVYRLTLIEMEILLLLDCKQSK